MKMAETVTPVPGGVDDTPVQLSNVSAMSGMSLL